MYALWHATPQSVWWNDFFLHLKWSFQQQKWNLHSDEKKASLLRVCRYQAPYHKSDYVQMKSHFWNLDLFSIQATLGVLWGQRSDREWMNELTNSKERDILWIDLVHFLVLIFRTTYMLNFAYFFSLPGTLSILVVRPVLAHNLITSLSILMTCALPLHYLLLLSSSICIDGERDQHK